MSEHTVPVNHWVRRAAKSDRASHEALDQRVYQAGTKGSLTEAIVELLTGAEDMAVIVTFLLAAPAVEEAVLAAARRGVRVYIMTASEQRLERQPRAWDEIERRRSDEHRALLDRLAGQVLVRSASGFHAKAIITDPHSTPKGMLLTSNLVHVDLNANKEVAVRLLPREVRSMYGALRWAFWEAAEHQVLQPGRLQAVSRAGVVEWDSPQQPIVTSTRHADEITEQAIASIQDADECVLTNFGWAADHPVVEALDMASRAGKAVTVVGRTSTRARRSSDALIRLASAGATVLGHDRMHAKVLLIPGKSCLLHSKNYTHDSDDSGLELGLRLSGRRATLVEQIVTSWIRSAPWRLVARTSAGAIRGHYIAVGGDRWDEQDVAAGRGRR